MMTIAETLKEIHDNVQKVYDAGYEKGNQTGTAKGKKELLDSFWEVYQDSGQRTEYSTAFAYMSDEFFKPKYNITPKTHLSFMFMYSTITGSLPDKLKDLGIKMDLSSSSNNAQDMFSFSLFTDLGEIYAPKVQTGWRFFGHMQNLKTIEKLTFNDNFAWAEAFKADYNLEKLIMGSKITKNGFNVQWSTKLSKESIISIINALSDTTSGLTVTLSKKAVNDAFETTPGAADGSQSEEWDLLIATKPKWKISLVE